MAKKKSKPWSKRKRIVMGSLGVFALIYIAVILWHTYKLYQKDFPLKERYIIRIQLK